MTATVTNKEIEMRNEPEDYVLARLFATLLFGAALFVVGFYMGEHRGYDTAKAECKPVPRAVTHKQKVRAIQWSMRDKGYLK